MEIGISTASYFPRLFTEDAMDEVARAGAKVSEVFFATHSEYTPEFAAVVKQRADRGGVRINSVHALTNQFEPELFGKGVRAHTDAITTFTRVCDAGKTLVNRLSPAFRFPDASVAVPPTFRAMLTPDARVKLEDNKATIEQGMNRVLLELVAVTDWNNDGTDDWLVMCRSGYTDTPRRFREYYLVIIDLKTPVLQPYVLMVLDHVYNRVKVQSDASAGELVESNAVEYLQGQAVVTQAPDSRSMKKKLEEGSSLKESSLSR